MQHDFDDPGTKLTRGLGSPTGIWHMSGALRYYLWMRKMVPRGGIDPIRARGPRSAPTRGFSVGIKFM